MSRTPETGGRSADRGTRSGRSSPAFSPYGGNESAIGSSQEPDAGPAHAERELVRLLARAAGQARLEVDDLVPVVYGELRRLAHHCLRNERTGHTLQTTALVHEAYLRLATFEQVVWRDRAHFLAIAARAMRRVLIDHAVARNAQKRQAGPLAPLEDDVPDAGPRVEELLEVDTALNRLERLNPRLARVVECRFFAGMSIEETAQALDTSPATVKRDWNVARAWLNRELAPD